MGTVGQKNENSFVLRIDPAARAGETRVTKAVAGQIGSGSRIFGRSQLPTERACFLQIWRHVFSEHPASFRFQ